jgi:hypothetical protein
MIINFVANFQTGYVGEVGDATHLCRELEALGHTVRRLPQDEWREHVIDKKPYRNIPNDIKADINIICKWHHFYDGSFITTLREKSGAPVFYWVWDYMWDSGMQDWHLQMIKASDLYLGNDVRSYHYPEELRKKLYYFPFDVADGSIPKFDLTKIYDVAFFGSWIGQGNRMEWLRQINETNPVTIFSWNNGDWPDEFDVHPVVYGEDFNRRVAESKIVLGFSVEPNCWGYWSNRVGKTLLAGGFLLYQYTPGMELFTRNGVEYFNSVEEAREKIDHYLIADKERTTIAQEGHRMAQERFSSRERVKDLCILIERYLRKVGEWEV